MILVCRRDRALPQSLARLSRHLATPNIGSVSTRRFLPRGGRRRGGDGAGLLSFMLYATQLC